MKHLGYIIALLVVMLVPAACTDSNNYVYNDVNAPAMLSFGFYKADNPGVLGADYVVELTADQTGGAATQTVSVALPPTVEKDNLVARFTTSEGTTVKVGGAEQVSQTTANDFSQPIDYILTRGSVSRRCEVTVTKASLRWVETAQVAGITTYGNPVLKINPVDQKPYIGFKTRAGNSATAANHSTVLTLGDDGEWTAVGGEGFGHTVNSSYFDFDIAPDGTLYVAYADQQATVLKNGMSVMKYNGSDWEFVGTDKGLLKAVSNYVGFCALDGELVGAQVNNSSKADYPNRTLVVSNYKDGASGQLGVRVKYYDKTQDAWLTLGGNVLPLGFTPDRHTEVALDTAPNGTPYVVYTNTLDQGFPYMMYLDPDTRQWSNPTKLADLAASGLNLKFTSDGVGYVTFTNSNHLHTLRTE